MTLGKSSGLQKVSAICSVFVLRRLRNFLFVPLSSSSAHSAVKSFLVVSVVSVVFVVFVLCVLAPLRETFFVFSSLATHH
jgi:hypothetical protein